LSSLWIGGGLLSSLWLGDGLLSSVWFGGGLRSSHWLGGSLRSSLWLGGGVVSSLRLSAAAWCPRSGSRRRRGVLGGFGDSGGFGGVLSSHGVDGQRAPGHHHDRQQRWW